MEQNKRNVIPSAKMSLAGILLRAALILLCLVLLCVHLMGSLFAKYSSHGEGSDDARVAKFDVQLIGTPENITVDAKSNSDGTYSITLSNHSEVAVRYTMNINMIETAGVTATFSTQTGQLAPNSTANLTLHFVVNWAEYTQSFTGPTASTTLDFTVTAHVEQID